MGMSKTKEQVEEEMKISLRIRIKPLDLDSMDSDELKQKAQKIFDTILQLETDKYDYEQRQLDQDVLQVREEDGHPKLRRPQEAVRGRRRGPPSRVARVDLEGEIRRVLEASRQEAAKVVRSATRQKGWRSGDTRG